MKQDLVDGVQQQNETRLGVSIFIFLCRILLALTTSFCYFNLSFVLYKMELNVTPITISVHMYVLKVKSLSKKKTKNARTEFDSPTKKN